ncbi:gamma-glutamyltransferase family protein [Aerophototrophica crusticola]|uniref:gamma-glutamyltransferase family protein n=1 Tax=Aerophototrophica crusticola TaxID=1709002 RepID=UPI00384EB513
MDAAVATALVLGLVEPQSSGLGGGGFLLVAMPDGTVTSFDGRETAGQGVMPDHFIGPDGKPLGFLKALGQGRPVGVPGLVAMLAEAHRKHGRLPWATLFEPAVALAERGVPAYPRMVHVLETWRRVLEQSPDLKTTYYRNDLGVPRVGEPVLQPEQAAALKLLAARGPDALYRGPIGKAMTDRLAAAAGAEGPPVLRPEDLAAYKAVERPAVCRPYRAWTVCGMGPPSAGGLGVLQILGMLEGHDMAALGKDNPQAWHLFAEASKRAYADREVYPADPDRVPVPVRGLLDKGYLTARAATIDPGRATAGKVPAGDPPYREGHAFGVGEGPDIAGTSHASFVDGDGMVVSMTNSVEFAFGSGLIAGGIVLNNQLTDFSFVPVDPAGRPVANAPGPGKRPRSSMAPMVVLDGQGRPVLGVGSPGGSAIIGYVAQALVAMLDWGLDPQAAIDLPIVLDRNTGTVVVEAVPQGDAVAAALMERGHAVKREETNSGLHAVRLVPGGIQGGADPRRDGVAAGD